MTRKIIGLMAIVMLTIACAGQAQRHWQSDHYTSAEGFYNPNLPPIEADLGRFFGILKRFITDDAPDTEAFGLIPYETLAIDVLTQQSQDVAYRLGHSTVLLKLSGKYILTDPIFSERASPVQWVGPKRFHPVPVDIASLPNLFAVVISHDHYDHLDQDTIEMLATRAQHFMVPLGLGAYLRDWGVPSENIHELDWWQSKQFNGFEFISTPAQHFSGRGMFNRNSTLWSSWVIQSPSHNIYFSGDSGYFDGFKTIGERYGPFDLTILENGAYNPDWSQVHMFPQETVQAHLDLKGKAMLPVHNGTFKLSFHGWSDPLEQVSKLSEKQGVLVQTPIMGEEVMLSEPKKYKKWWQPAFESQKMAQKD
ncbi:MBL fold metallo-hydrolase [Oceaniserpentilla sp. 4NH20-0058]|uniref:MBL fold metallo-hydrolase n=1 Tax=Oceaniserpentilla sp. 4NH20-0058 TaxID=3127660 RepID=UPI0031038883